jgi:hypothetical protein
LKLNVKHGGALWRAHNAHTDVLLHHSDQQLKQVGDRITKINQRRKLQQEKAKAEMDRLQSKYSDALKRNIEIEVACRGLELDVKDLRDNVDSQWSPKRATDHGEDHKASQTAVTGAVEMESSGKAELGGAETEAENDRNGMSIEEHGSDEAREACNRL